MGVLMGRATTVVLTLEGLNKKDQTKVLNIAGSLLGQSMYPTIPLQVATFVKPGGVAQAPHTGKEPVKAKGKSKGPGKSPQTIVSPYSSMPGNAESLEKVAEAVAANKAESTDETKAAVSAARKERQALCKEWKASDEGKAAFAKVHHLPIP